MSDLRRMALLCALGASGYGGAIVVRAESDPRDVMDLLEPEPLPARPKAEAPRVRTVEHQHSREIARRLRQQAKLEAKRAKATGAA